MRQVTPLTIARENRQKAQRALQDSGGKFQNADITVELQKAKTYALISIAASLETMLQKGNNIFEVHGDMPE